MQACSSTWLTDKGCYEPTTRKAIKYILLCINKIIQKKIDLRDDSNVIAWSYRKHNRYHYIFLTKIQTRLYKMIISHWSLQRNEFRRSMMKCDSFFMEKWINYVENQNSFIPNVSVVLKHIYIRICDQSFLLWQVVKNFK